MVCGISFRSKTVTVLVLPLTIGLAAFLRRCCVEAAHSSVGSNLRFLLPIDGNKLLKALALASDAVLML